MLVKVSTLTVDTFLQITMSSPHKITRPKVSPRNRADEITHLLRRAIVEGEIKPGSALAEPVLAERFGASRAPVREALIALEREGLVVFNDRSRTHVRRFDDADFEEIRLMRIALEGLAARLAAAQWNKENARVVEANLKQQENARTLGELSQLDVEMHEYIVRLTGHQRLISAWQGIRWQFQMCLAYTHRLQEQLAFEPRQITVNSHRQLLAALASGKPEFAEKTMAAHIRSSAEWLPAVASPDEAPKASSSRKRQHGRNAAKVALVLLLGAWCATSRAEAVPQDSQFFESKVLPVLQQRCYECHSHEKKIKGGLALDSRSGWEHGGDTGPAIEPGNVEKSLLIKAVRHLDADYEMPPKGKLPAEEIAVLEQWVKEGAVDPRVAAAAKMKQAIDIEKGRKHWAFHPVVDTKAPAVKDAAWPLDDVDAFILAKLEASGLKPSSDADPYTLLRRVSLDLTGLPPTPQDIENFTNDLSSSSSTIHHSAFTRQVDRLLNSKAFGERWARHWLDLTGYADQVGTSNSVFAEYAWRYRDYLIDSFNADKPFNRFIREQIAGDLLPFKSPEERAANLVATGFLVLGDLEIVNPDKLKMETDHIDQQVSKVGMAFMGMTLGCVRCHDHKFDPIGLEDYYGIAGMFRSTVSTKKIPYGVWSGIMTVELPETAEQTGKRKELEIAHQQKLERLKAEKLELEQDKVDVVARLSEPEADKEALTKKRDDTIAKIKKLEGEINHAEFFKPSVPRAFAVQDAEKPADMAITIRGNPYAPGAHVPRGMMRVASWDKTPSIPEGQSGRVQLADWLADTRNPLTARVTVNRIWQKLFGEGIVRSVDYFGTRGELPSHPELLDHLASRFMSEGWSQKQLIRSLVLSRTYRMSSGHDDIGMNKDPDNRLLWRMNRQRLDAEALRDAMLVVSGGMKISRGGPGMALEYVENTGGLSPTGVNPPAFSLKKFRPEQEFERTVYLPIIRSSQVGPASLRDVFDFTQPAQMAGKRSQTVVPTQALFLLNNDLLRRRAGDLAKQLTALTSDRDVRMEKLWLSVLNRPVTAAERSEATAFLDRIGNLLQSNADREHLAWLELGHTLLSSNEFIYRL